MQSKFHMHFLQHSYEEGYDLPLTSSRCTKHIYIGFETLLILLHQGSTLIHQQNPKILSLSASPTSK
jgi:hypothetical protein